MTLFFKICGQKLERQDDKVIAGYARNYIDVIFDFDKLWIDLLKYALFIESNGTRHVVELGYGKTLSCKIPNDILKNSYFYISVFAGDLLTSTQEMVLIAPSGYTSDLDDLDEGEVIKDSSSEVILDNKKNVDDEGYYWGRRNRFERREHPYI